MQLAPEMELRLVFDGDHAFFGRDKAGKHSHESRLAGARAAGDENVQPAGNGRLQERDQGLR